MRWMTLACACALVTSAWPTVARSAPSRARCPRKRRLTFTSTVPGAAALGLLIAVVATGIGMVGPVLSYELLERHGAARGALLGRQAAAGNLGQALGSFSAGSLFAWHPMAPFWTSALVLAFGAAVVLTRWGPARDGEIAAGERNLDTDRD